MIQFPSRPGPGVQGLDSSVNIWIWISKIYLGSMSRDVHSYAHWLRPRNLPHPPALGSYMRALLVKKDRRHLFLTP